MGPIRDILMERFGTLVAGLDSKNKRIYPHSLWFCAALKGFLCSLQSFICRPENSTPPPLFRKLATIFPPSVMRQYLHLHLFFRFWIYFTL
jgi:hypothetical protein